MYDQNYIDNLPVMKASVVDRMRVAERKKLRHYAGERPCPKCGCLVRTVSQMTGKHSCSECLGTFRDLPVQLPKYQYAASTLKMKQAAASPKPKPSPTSAAKVESSIMAHNKRVKKTLAKNWCIPVVFSGMNTSPR